MSDENVLVPGNSLGMIVADYGDETGFENQTSSDMVTPYLQVLQTNSPQIDEDDPSYIQGAKHGMLLNTATGEIYEGREQGVLFVPSCTAHLYVEYRPRDEGGGFLGTHEASSEIVRNATGEFNELRTAEGTELTETFYIYGVLVGGDVSSPETLHVVGGIIIPFASTKIKAYKKWNTSVRTHMVVTPNGRRVNPPIFANLVRVTTVPDENKKGKFNNIRLAPAIGGLKDSLLPPTGELFTAAKEFGQLVRDGGIKVADPSPDAPVSSGDSVDTPF